MADDEEKQVRVALRVRPLNEREIAGEQTKVWRCLPHYNSITQTSSNGRPLPDIKGNVFFTFDRIFDESCNTEEVYAGVADDIVQSVVRGLNGTIFAYGQTSSGKTFTMQGANGGETPGIVQKAATSIFSLIGENLERDFLLRVSYLEIYNEEIRDLLTSDSSKLQIREDPRKGVYVEAKEEIVTNFDTIVRALKFGERLRHVDSTAMNERSSRSHTIFRMVVESKERFTPGVHKDESEVDDAVLVATLNLVDLAGSESVRHTGATGARQKEGGKINQSLLSLSRVIQNLSQGGSAHVNFRDSKLTRILQPSLSGNASMAIIACVTPAEAYLEETRSTLQFAQRAKLIKTRATINEVIDDRAQLKRLKRELEELKNAQALSVSLKNEVVSRENGHELKEELDRVIAERAEQEDKINRLTALILNHAPDTYPDSTSFSANDDIGTVRLGKRAKRARETWCPGETFSFSERGGILSFLESDDDSELMSSSNRQKKSLRSSLCSSHGSTMPSRESMATSELGYMTTFIEEQKHDDSQDAAEIFCDMDALIESKRVVELEANELRNELQLLRHELEDVKSKAAQTEELKTAELEALVESKNAADLRLKDVWDELEVVKQALDKQSAKSAEYDILFESKCAVELQVSHMQKEPEVTRAAAEEKISQESKIAAVAESSHASELAMENMQNDINHLRAKIASTEQEASEIQINHASEITLLMESKLASESVAEQLRLELESLKEIVADNRQVSEQDNSHHDEAHLKSKQTDELLIDSLNAEIKTLKEGLAFMTDEDASEKNGNFDDFASLMEAKCAVEHELKNMHADLDLLKSTIEEQDIKSVEFQGIIDSKNALEEELENMRAEFIVMKNTLEIQTLKRTELNAIIESKNAAELLVKSTQEELDNVRDALDEKNAKIKSLLESKCITEHSNGKNQEELENLKRRIEDEHATELKKLEESKLQSDILIETMRIESARREEEKSEKLKVESEKVARVVAEMEALHESNRASEILVNSMRAELASLREEMTDVKCKADTEEEKKLFELKALVDSKAATEVQLNNIREELQIANEEALMQSKKSAELETLLVESKCEAELQLRKMHVELEAARAATEEQSAEISNLRKEIELLHQSMDAAERNAAEIQAAHASEIESIMDYKHASEMELQVESKHNSEPLVEHMHLKLECLEENVADDSIFKTDICNHELNSQLLDYENLKMEIEVLKEELAERNSQLHDYESSKMEIEVLKEELAERKEELSKRTDELAEKTEELAEKTEELAEKTEEISDRKKNYENLVLELKSSNELELCKVREELEVLWVSKDDEIAQYVDEIEVLQEKKIQSDILVDSMRIKLAAQEEKMKKESEAAADEIVQLVSEVEALKKSKCADDVVLNNLRVEMASLKEEMAKVEMKGAEQNVQFVSDMEMLKESKRASDLLVESMRVELDSLREEMTDVERKAAAEQNAQLFSEMEALMEGKCAAESLAQNMQSELESLREAMADAERRAAKEQALLVTAAQDKVNALQEKVALRDARIEKLEQVKLTKDQVTRLKEMKDNAIRHKEENEKLKYEVEELNGKLNKMAGVDVTSVESMKARVEELEELKDLLTLKLRKYVLHCKKLEGERGSIESALQSAGIDCAPFSSNLAEAVTALADYKNTGSFVSSAGLKDTSIESVSDSQIILLRSQLAEKTSNELELQSQLKEKSQTIDELNADLLRLKEKMKLGIAKLRELMEFEEEARGKIQSLELENTQLQEKITNDAALLKRGSVNEKQLQDVKDEAEKKILEMSNQIEKYRTVIKELEVSEKNAKKDAVGTKQCVEFAQREILHLREALASAELNAGKVPFLEKENLNLMQQIKKFKQQAQVLQSEGILDHFPPTRLSNISVKSQISKENMDENKENTDAKAIKPKDTKGKKRSKNDDNELYNCGKILDMMTECGFSDISEIDKDEYEENQTQECRQS